jgi:hypothetical protein
MNGNDLRQTPVATSPAEPRENAPGRRPWVPPAVTFEEVLEALAADCEGLGKSTTGTCFYASS